ncbi:MAG: TIGR04348 family glycosyltransferase [Planctomycetes bacterium]|jgi:putative glycosyltransferase (TIGR04348 family)|nr:TIGR04348 family glycosyltransferase [Planctomycetota bacterium]MDP6408205.1 selenoneine biosynthesis selenosugar synthase SenB [Planctomycetota bacterium]
MRIAIITHTRRGSRGGNRVTALRWAGLLRRAGHRVTIGQYWRGDATDVLVALHATHSAAELERYHAAHPAGPSVLVLTGTDVYVDLPAAGGHLPALELATHLVALNPCVLDAIPAVYRARASVITQSARAVDGGPPDPERFEVLVAGHLRRIKDPFLAPRAARLLPETSRLLVTHVGGALDEAMRRLAEKESERNPRYRWLGERPRREVLERLDRARALVVTSVNEGGPGVVTEALACTTPILSTRIPAAEGLLGADYPGFFGVGEVGELARALGRIENDPAFLDVLRARCAALRASVDPAREQRDLERLLEGLTLPAD